MYIYYIIKDTLCFSNAATLLTSFRQCLWLLESPAEHCTVHAAFDLAETVKYVYQESMQELPLSRTTGGGGIMPFEKW